MKNKQKNKNQTYAQVAKTVAQKVIDESNIKQTSTLRIHTNTELRTTIAVIHAHIHNLIAPCAYSTEPNRTLTQHALPTIEAPDNPPSGDLFNKKNLIYLMMMTGRQHSNFNNNKLINQDIQ